MRLFSVDFWALWWAFGLLVLAAVINARTLMVPNRLSLPAAVGGWSIAFLVSGLQGIPSQGGGILASLVGTGIGFALLLPFYATGYLGAGCVKMQAAFGAWVGCTLSPAQTAQMVGLGTVVGALLSAALWLIMWRININRANRQDPDSHLFRLVPAQVTLSVGSISAAVALVVMAWE